MNMQKAKLATLRKQLETLTDLSDELQTAVKRAWSSFDGLEGSSEPLKDDFGKITDAGVAMMDFMFASGDPNWKIANAFDVSPSAVVYRRKRWEAQKSNKRDED